MDSQDTRNVILAAAFGYDPPDLRPFLVSARENATDARIILFVHRGDDAYRRELESLNPNVELVVTRDASLRKQFWQSGEGDRRNYEIPKWKRRWFAFCLRTPFDRKALATLHIHFVRYFWIKEVIDRGILRRASSVALADSRDTIFQANPFSPDAPPGLTVAEEKPAYADLHRAMKWFKKSYSKAIAKSMKTKHSLCTGFVVGDRASVVRFIDLILEQYRLLGPKIFAFGRDQLINNIVLRSESAPPVTILPQNNPFIVHLIQCDLDDYRLDDQGLKSRDGEKFAVVHQYDRFEPLNEYARRRYG